MFLIEHINVCYRSKKIINILFILGEFTTASPLYPNKQYHMIKFIHKHKFNKAIYKGN